MARPSPVVLGRCRCRLLGDGCRRFLSSAISRRSRRRRDQIQRFFGPFGGRVVRPVARVWRHLRRVHAHRAQRQFAQFFQFLGFVFETLQIRKVFNRATRPAPVAVTTLPLRPLLLTTAGFLITPIPFILPLSPILRRTGTQRGPETGLVPQCCRIGKTN